MQTNFTEEQRRDPAIRDAEPILRSCVHYGFCTATCPTYTLSRDENDGPRGRIDLIGRMLESGQPPDARTVHYLDRCLSCLGCMSTCAVRVNYMHLIDIARTHIERTYRRPALERLVRAVIAFTLPHPARMAVAMRAARLARPFRALLPKPMRAMVAMVPDTKDMSSHHQKPAVFPAEGSRRKRVAFLPGCAQQVLDAGLNEATIRLLTRLGCEVVVPPGLGCCGALTLHMGKAEHGKRLAAQTIRSLAEEHQHDGLDAFVVNASGCGTQIKDYGSLFRDDPALAGAADWLSGIARDITEIVSELGLPEELQRRAYRVAYHDACSLRHGQKITAQPRALLRDAGYEVTDVPEGHFCCGSAGTYNILQPELAEELGRRKAGHIASTEPDFAAMGNIGCLTQIRRHSRVPTVHTVELLDWATGGPIPRRLADANLRPAPIAMTTTTTAEPAEAPASFW